MGHFKPDRSDIDFVGVTDGELYIPREALRRYDPKQARHPHVEPGVGQLRVEYFKPDWVIQRYVRREFGVARAGPPPDAVIDPVSPGDIRGAVRSSAVWSLAIEPTEK